MTRKLLLACLLAGAGLTAYAGHGGGPSGGMSAGHMSSAGLANGNGANAADRDKGLDRAEDRRSDNGADHEQADRAHAKTKRHHSPPELPQAEPRR